MLYDGISVTTNRCFTPLQKAVRADGDPVKLAVHYESLCPDSIRFVEEQLAVTYPVYKDIMEVDIYPYGFASVRILDRVTYNVEHAWESKLSW